jgi:hypothetical protein
MFKMVKFYKTTIYIKHDFMANINRRSVKICLCDIDIEFLKFLFLIEKKDKNV